MVTSPDVGRAFRVVPRHLFVPDSDLANAYRDEVIFTKSRNGISLSASSAPSIMAEMLELLAVKPGHRVLEVGAGTGYNAALMEEIVGPGGHVVTLDIDQDIVHEAITHLRTAQRGEHITVRCGDGGLGWPEGAPYDRIIVATGAWDMPPAWFRQLADGGRLLLLERSVTPGARGLARHGLDDEESEGLVETLGAMGFGGVERQTHRAGRRTLVVISATALPRAA